MRRNTELAETVQTAMDARHLSRNQLAEVLGMNRFMIEKLLCGDIIPSTHLQKQLEEILGIPSGSIRQEKIA
jgi:ribosome-binding protein aMBF1 (putative translation factor)